MNNIIKPALYVTFLLTLANVSLATEEASEEEDPMEALKTKCDQLFEDCLIYNANQALTLISHLQGIRDDFLQVCEDAYWMCVTVEDGEEGWFPAIKRWFVGNCETKRNRCKKKARKWYDKAIKQLHGLFGDVTVACNDMKELCLTGEGQDEFHGDGDD